MTDPIGNNTFPYFTEEHEMLRETLRRFIADKVMPNGDQWEKDGYVPREILREMGSLGLLGMRYPPEYGGAGLDTLANAIFAEELGRSTYRRLRRHRACPHRHGLDPPFPCRHGGAKAALDAWHHRRRD